MPRIYGGEGVRYLPGVVRAYLRHEGIHLDEVERIIIGGSHLDIYTIDVYFGPEMGDEGGMCIRTDVLRVVSRSRPVEVISSKTDCILF